MNVGDKVFVTTWVGPCGAMVLGVVEAVVDAPPLAASDDEKGVLSLVQVTMDGERRIFSANGVFATREEAEAKVAKFYA